MRRDGNRAARLGKSMLLAALLSAGAAGAAQAAVCSDYATETLMANNIMFNTRPIPFGSPADLYVVSTPLNMAAGDKLLVRVTWTRASVAVGTMTAMRLYSTEPNLIFDTTTPQPNSLTGDVSFGPYTATGNATAVVSVTAPNVDVVDGDVYITCVPASAGGGGGGGNADSAALDDIRATIGRRSVFAGAAMLSDLVHAGTRGGPGVIAVALDDKGTMAWSGLRFDGLLSGTGQWTGGQGVGAAGVTFAPAEDLQFGVFAGFEALAYDRTTVGQTLRGTGGTLGANLGFRLTEAWRIEGFIAASQLNYAIGSNAITGSYQGQRFLGDVRVLGAIPISETLSFEPEFGLVVVNERQSAFTDSAGVAHAAIDLGGAEANVGGTLVFVIPAEFDLTFRLGAQARLGSAGTSGQLKAEVEALLGEAGVLTLGLSASQLGTTQPAVGVQGTLSLRF